MKILDCHIHLFAANVITNVAIKTQLVRKLKLQTEGAAARIDLETLKKDMAAGGVEGALMLPTASVNRVKKTNRDCVKLASGLNWLMTAGTLHPGYSHNEEELAYLRQQGVRVIKLCSFSQGFTLDAPQTLHLFDAIEAANGNSDTPFSVILDTLQGADGHFGTLPIYNTTPKLLGELAARYPGINFIGAHMGGLDGSIEDLCRYLIPRSNFFLDTSNAAHTLTEKEFLALLEIHGPRHILFGTDWPWFTHESEVKHIDGLLDRAGFSEAEKSQVFSGNLLTLVGMRG
ncbi:MAG: amidohydrolase family protein [Pseudomonadota bacterium]